MPDDTVARLTGARLPDIELPATTGARINLSRLQGRHVIFCHPYTGRPGTPDPPDWDVIPGAHGSTPQALAYSLLLGEFQRRSVKIFGLSLQDTAWQQEFALRCRTGFPLLSDKEGQFSKALGLPVFHTGHRTFLRRLTMIIGSGTIEVVRYPVERPEMDASETLALLGPPSA
jgi:peroxiredoxin